MINTGVVLVLLQLLTHPKTDSSWRSKYDIIKPSGKLFIVKKYYYDTLNLMRIDKKWKAGIVNRKGDIILDLVYDDVGLFSEGMAEVVKKSSCSSCWDTEECKTFSYEGDHGFVNERGNVIIPLKYSAVGQFHEGLAWVIVERSDGSLLSTFIDKSGKSAFNLVFDEARRFQGGTALITYSVKGKKYYNYINHSGKLLIPSKFNFLEPYKAGHIRAFRREGFYRFIDSSGIEKNSSTYEIVDVERKNDWQHLRMVGNYKKFGYVDEKNGDVVIPVIYDSLFLASKSLLWAKKENKWGLISKVNENITPFQFDHVESFYEHLACVCIDKKYGFVDTLGNFRIKPIFDEAHYFNEGMGIFRQNDKYGYINSSGEIVIPAKYNYLNVFKNNYAKARWGFIYVTINKSDKWISWSLNYESKIVIFFTALLSVISYLYWRNRRRATLHRS